MGPVKSFLCVVLCVAASFAEDFSLFGGCNDTVIVEAGSNVSIGYSLECGMDHALGYEVEFPMCFSNVIDSPQISYQNSLAEVSYQPGFISAKIINPWSFYRLFTVSGKIKELEPRSSGVSISFMVRAMVLSASGDTVRLEKLFTIIQVKPQTLKERLSNGMNQVSYNGQGGYLIYACGWPGAFFVDSLSGLRGCLPHGSCDDSSLYYKAVAASWGWDLSKAKTISSSLLDSFPLRSNLVIKPGVYCLENSGQYWESSSFGKINEVSKDLAESKYGQKTVRVPDSFFRDYQSSALPVLASPKYQRQKSIGSLKAYDLSGKLRSFGAPGSHSFGVRIINASGQVRKDIQAR